MADAKKSSPTKNRFFSVAEVKQLKDAYRENVLPMQATARKIETLERIVSDTVNAAYGLTPEEVALMWSTAPPRMPLSPPSTS